MAPQATESGHPTGLFRPHDLPPDLPQNQAERRGYKVEIFEGLGAPQTEAPKLFETEGTHLFLEELESSDVINVRFNDEQAPWLEMEEGDTFVREYQRFWVRSNSRFVIAPFDTRVRAKFVASIGPTVLRAPKKYGLRSGFYTVGGTATTAGVDAFAGFTAQYGGLLTPSGARPVAMKFGGTVIIDNRDLANDLYFYMGVAGAFVPGGASYPSILTACRVPANKTIAAIFENSIINLTRTSASPAAAGVTLVIATGAGTAAFGVTLSRFAVDFTDPDSILAGSGIPVLKQ